MDDTTWGTDFVDWRERAFAPPAPREVKLATIMRHYIPESTWIETGTYLAETTAAMAEIAPRVYSIEPKPEFVEAARAQFAEQAHVEIIQGISETELPALLSRISDNKLSFWLDGHWSMGNTFLGPKVSPIVDELHVIDHCLARLDSVSIAIDDIRCFDQADGGFPGLEWLADWAFQRDLSWIIEHDIFIAKSRDLPWIPGVV
jgi:hypothetical protein